MNFCWVLTRELVDSKCTKSFPWRTSTLLPSPVTVPKSPRSPRVVLRQLAKGSSMGRGEGGEQPGHRAALQQHSVPMLPRFLPSWQPLPPNQPYSGNRPEQITCVKSTLITALAATETELVMHLLSNSPEGRPTCWGNEQQQFPSEHLHPLPSTSSCSSLRLFFLNRELQIYACKIQLCITQLLLRFFLSFFSFSMILSMLLKCGTRKHSKNHQIWSAS